MNLPAKWKNPRVTMFIGMTALAVALGFLKYVPASAHFDLATKDGVFGFLIGISIGMNLWTVRLRARERDRNST